MIVLVISGGVGSQLFQYAAGYSLAKEKKCKLLLDCSFYYTDVGILYHARHSGFKGLVRYIKLSNSERKIFNNKSLNRYHSLKLHELINCKNEIFIKNIWLSRILRTWFSIINCITFSKIKYVRIDLKNPFELETMPDAINYFINGYPNNIGYFYKNINEILKKFYINHSNNKKIKIGIHIRKGEIINTEMDICSADYYNRGVKEVIKKNSLTLNNVEILIFCEELTWPKKNIKIKGADLKFIIGNDENAVEDFKKMSNCTHLIMSNSTFSWWAAARIDKVLGGMIICPDLWFDKISVDKINIYPQGWKVLPTNVFPREYRIN